MDKSKDAWQRKTWLIISLVINLGLLSYFKYFNFFIDTFVQSFSLFGIDLNAPTLNIILPVGISFYTFQTLSYTIDIYRRKINSTDDIVAFFTFVSFFPQLIIGPIERASRLLPQMTVARKFDESNARHGLRQILWGLFKKAVIADNINILVNDIFNHADSYSSLFLFIALMLFAIQVYADFSGYSDMAIGTAHLFGIRLMTNFRYPFFSRDFMEFFQRWHISLSTWFRDYLFIPLGGSRHGELRLSINVVLVFFISGLWHGASYNYILWGVSCGLIYLIYRFSGLSNKAKVEEEPHPKLIPRHILQMMLTFLCFSGTMIFIRTSDFGHTVDYFYRLVTQFGFGIPIQKMTPVMPWVSIMIIAEWVQRRKAFALQIEHLNKPLRWVIYILIIQIILLFGTFNRDEFFYFQF